MLIVVAYDIANDRRRTRLRKLLLGYGVPVQESVVECELTEAQLREMRERVGAVIERRADSVLYYSLCAECAPKTVDGRGKRRPPRQTVLVV